MNKRFVIVLASVFLAGLVAALLVGTLTRRGAAPPAPTTQPQPEAIGPPSFPRQATTIKPSYITAATPLPFPGQLAAVSVAPTQSLASLAQAVAGRLGFSGNPEARETSLGVKYRWKKQGTSLSVGDDPVTIAYTAPRTPGVGFSQSADDLATIARSFIENAAQLPPAVTIESSPPVFLAPVGFDPVPTDDPAKASLVELRFQYTIGGIPFFSRLPDSPGSTISIDPAGTVVSASILWLPAVVFAEEFVAVAPYGVASNRLTTGEGVFVRASPDTSSYVDPLTINVSLSTIQKVELGYYYSPGSFVLAPVYVFYGSGQHKKKRDKINTTTVVSAVP